MDEMLEDEACHVRERSGEPVAYTLDELAEMDFSHRVSLFNTMRFDVNLYCIRFMLADGVVEKETIVEAIRNAIAQAVDDVLGRGLDGIPIPFGPQVEFVTKSKMLHREKILFDLS
jgi:hypothetical protein